MKALVTGGSGYFGSLLLERLKESGHTVSSFDLVCPDKMDRDVCFFQGDIRDLRAVERACFDIDVIFHNVAQVPLAKDKALFWQVNRDGMENILRAASARGVKSVVYTSSSAVFGVPKTCPVTENTEPTPAEAYGKAKYAAERICEEWASKSGVAVSVIRPRTILGLGRMGIFQILFDWVYRGFNVPVLGAGDNLYQFVHALDLADACIASSKMPGFNVYNCGAERFGSMRELLETLCAHAKTGSRVRSVPMGLAEAGMKITSSLGLSPLGPYHAMMYGRSLYFDITKAKTELGWQPKYSNDEMICQSYDWYVTNRDEVLKQRSRSAHKSAVKQGLLGLVKYLM